MFLLLTTVSTFTDVVISKFVNTDVRDLDPSWSCILMPLFPTFHDRFHQVGMTARARQVGFPHSPATGRSLLAEKSRH
jgi:hypothetical protein